jgi:hypothetical protein
MGSMKAKHLLILFSLLGISASFMPWLTYPKMNLTIHGYVGDGLVTGFAFSVILFTVVIGLRKRRMSTFSSVTIGILSLLLCLSSYRKLFNYNFEKSNYQEDNPLLASATAGYHLEYGVYVLILASFSVFIVWLVIQWFQYFSKPSKDKVKKSLITPLTTSLSIIAIGLIGYWGFNYSSSAEIDRNELQNVFKTQVYDMGQAMISEDYSKFTDYNHPSLVESYGGRANFMEVIRNTMNDLKIKNVAIKDISLNDIESIATLDDNIQVVISQNVTFNTQNTDNVEVQKMIAVSEDKGNTWSYININKKSKTELSKFFPFLLEDLKF